MDRDRIIDNRDEIEEMLKASELANYDDIDDLDDRFDEAAKTVERILVGDISEWVGQFYRERYRAWKNEGREAPPCRCDNPRCSLKRGEIPYRLRRRASKIRDGGSSGREALSGFLDSHPEAVVIDEALDRQEEIASDLGREFRKLHRELEAAIMELTDDPEQQAAF
ncbi:hypothetical protein [Halolamina sp.]|uniref:hypothetical protein n=1 Tax=Halolamina sp. TaxID=1940283 RepID=UPI0035633E82